MVHGCSHGCMNTDMGDGFVCTCPEGYELGYDDKTCQGARRAQFRSRTVWVLLKTQQPAAGSGQRPRSHANVQRISKPKSFADIDECAKNSKGGCSHICENVPGSYKCSCPPGYQLGADLRTCSGQFTGSLGFEFEFVGRWFVQYCVCLRSRIRGKAVPFWGTVRAAFACARERTCSVPPRGRHLCNLRPR